MLPEHFHSEIKKSKMERPGLNAGALQCHCLQEATLLRVFSSSFRLLHNFGGHDLLAIAQSLATTGWLDDLWLQKRLPTPKPA